MSGERPRGSLTASGEMSLADPSRRLVAAAPLLALLSGCSAAEEKQAERGVIAQSRARKDGRLTLTGVFDPGKASPPGTFQIGGGARRTVLFVPRSPPPPAGYPLALMMHGATQRAQFAPAAFGEAAERLGLVMVAPNSASQTWDLSRGPHGTDAATIQAALDGALQRTPIDRRRIACCGFSDGASYALSLGVTDGDLFSDILAFSPGFMVPGEPHGKPRVFISHGRQDNILPFSGARRIARTLKSRGYDVEFYAFKGGHWPVPQAIERGFGRFLTRTRPPGA